MEFTRGQLLVIIVMQWFIVALFAHGWHTAQTDLDATRATVLEEKRAHEALELLLEQADAEVQTYENMYTQITDSLDNEWNYSIGEATAYAPFDNKSGTCNDGDAITTSTGVKPGPNIIAVDPERIPYGSSVLVFLPNGECITGVAGDTGGALRDAEGLLVDVFKYTYEEAITFGVKDVLILWK